MHSFVATKLQRSMLYTAHKSLSFIVSLFCISTTHRNCQFKPISRVRMKIYSQKISLQHLRADVRYIRTSISA